MKKMDYISGGFLFVFSLIIFIYSIYLNVWVENAPGEGLFPLVLSLLLGGLSIIILLNARFHPGRSEEKLSIVGHDRVKFFLYLAAFIVFALFFATVGYSLMLAAFVIFILKIAEKQSWKTTLAAAFIAVIFSYVLFTICLSVSLPEGFLSGLLQRLK